MSETRIIKRAEIAGLLAAVLAKTGRVVAPVKREAEYRYAWLEAAEKAALPDVNAVNTIKEFFFPRAEAILTYKREGRHVEVTPAPAAVAPFIVFGARPCDAGALVIMDKVFSWDTTDGSWKARRDAATVVTVACAKSDEYCFCTSVGLAPDGRSGSDVMLTPLENGDFSVQAVTARGEAFVKEYAKYFSAGAVAKAAVAQVQARLDAAAKAKWLKSNFESPLWGAQSERCVGCGVCTYYCPTCHCFDIQDEADGGRGARLKGWDSCSFALFTKHTSGHNPRPDRASRWRQRIMHKFSYYPERFGVISCTGCGRCGRHCPVDLGVELTLRGIPDTK